MEEQKLTWIQWQKSNLRNWIGFLLGLTGFIISVYWTGPEWSWGMFIVLDLTLAMWIICLIKGIINGWKEYKDGRTS